MKKPSERIKEIYQSRTNLGWIEAVMDYLDERWMKDKCIEKGIDEQEATTIVEQFVSEKEEKYESPVKASDFPTDLISKQKVLQLIEEMREEKLRCEHVDEPCTCEEYNEESDRFNQSLSDLSTKIKSL